MDIASNCIHAVVLSSYCCMLLFCDTNFFNSQMPVSVAIFAVVRYRCHIILWQSFLRTYLITFYLSFSEAFVTSAILNISFACYLVQFSVLQFRTEFE